MGRFGTVVLFARSVLSGLRFVCTQVGLFIIDFAILEYNEYNKGIKIRDKREREKSGITG